VCKTFVFLDKNMLLTTKLNFHFTIPDPTEGRFVCILGKTPFACVPAFRAKLVLTKHIVVVGLLRGKIIQRDARAYQRPNEK
jgi:hypothetical protein